MMTGKAKGDVQDAEVETANVAQEPVEEESNEDD